MSLQAMRKLVEPLARRAALMVARAVVELTDDTRKTQQLQLSLLVDELRGEVERLQEYGFTSVPLPGAQAVALAVGGSRDHLVAVAVDDARYRPHNLQPGEVAVYTDQGDMIIIKRGGTVEVTAATKVRLLTPLVEATGALHVTGNITSDANITAAGSVADQGGAKTMAGMRAAFNSHRGHGTPGTGNTPDASM